MAISGISKQIDSVDLSKKDKITGKDMDNFRNLQSRDSTKLERKIMAAITKAVTREFVVKEGELPYEIVTIKGKRYRSSFQEIVEET